MDIHIRKHILFLIAGLVWFFAGINILRIGVLTWMEQQKHLLYITLGAVFIFIFFFFVIFKPLFYKHTARIRQKKEKSCMFSFFDVKGWVMMIFMISLGITIRHFQLLPPAFIAAFYTGLSTALIATGILFIIQWKKDSSQ